ncbi:hypothetical protein K492DRAFT_163965 [Lichtheimia hyalospora FSU 10163]|nr:hypothetical protein K492DRAFT_163965 [Lichtheimia hyalospora FSU 10163]
MRYSVSVASSTSTYTSVESPKHPFQPSSHGNLVLSQSPCLSQTAHSLAFKSKAKTHGHGYIDYCNLYIKNIDSSISSNDLYDVFKRYGHIVSARVMSNPVNGQSKGFGFVSYTHVDEAAAALKGMNGQVVGVKQLTVAYHEPRKLRTMSPAFVPQQQPTTSSYPFQPSSSTLNESTSRMQYSRSTSRFKTIDTQSDMQVPDHHHAVMASTSASTPTNRTYAYGTKETMISTRRKQSPLMIESTMTRISDIPQHNKNAFTTDDGDGRPTPANKSLHLPYSQSQQRLNHDNTTEKLHVITQDLRRVRLAEAATRLATFDYDLNQVVDLLSTMSETDQATCLFNPQFLSQKLQVVMNILHQTNDPSEQTRMMLASTTTTLNTIENPINIQHPSSNNTMMTLTAPWKYHQYSNSYGSSDVSGGAQEEDINHHENTLGDVQPAPVSTYLEFEPDPETCYTPVAEPPYYLFDTNGYPSPPDEYKSEFTVIQEKLSQMKNATILQRRQMLGDHLFPYVKRTGVKRAPKVTVYLLDTIKPEELATIMFDKVWLDTYVKHAAAQVERYQ